MIVNCLPNSVPWERPGERAFLKSSGLYSASRSEGEKCCQRYVLTDIYVKSKGVGGQRPCAGVVAGDTASMAAAWEAGPSWSQHAGHAATPAVRNRSQGPRNWTRQQANSFLLNLSNTKK